MDFGPVTVYFHSDLRQNCYIITVQKNFLRVVTRGIVQILLQVCILQFTPLHFAITPLHFAAAGPVSLSTSVIVLSLLLV